MQFKNICSSFLVVGICFATIAHAQKTGERKLVVITFDGYRWEDVFRGADSTMLAKILKGKKDSAERMNLYWSANGMESRKKLMPFLWNTIAAKGQVYGNRDAGSKANVKNSYWFSYPGYNEIFTGFPDSTINSNDLGPNPNKTVLEFFNEQKAYKSSVAAFTSWAAYTRILNKERSGLLINAGFANYEGRNLTEVQKFLNGQQHQLPKVFDPNERHDAVTYYLAKECLEQEHPKVLYIAFIETDAYAHRNLYDMYLASGNNNDKMIEDLWNYLQSDPFYKDQTTLVLATDHGRGDNTGENWTHHNRKTRGSDAVWFAVMGPYTKPSGEIKNTQIYQDQYAQTMAALLGMKFTSTKPVGEPIYNVITK